MWKQGPLPKNTFNWGAVVKAGDDPQRGFYFANFCGDHCEIVTPSNSGNERLEPHQVGWYNNSIEMPKL